MNKEFPRVLSLLRKERGLSQKAVASELGVSQALMSHYEKGVREPGLDFLCKVAAFYGVSTDYLLGLSSERRPGEVLPDVHKEAENSLRGRSLSAALGKNLTLSAVNVLFGLMEQERFREFAGCAQQYLGFGLYKVFRLLTKADPEHLQGLFSLPEITFLEAGNAAQQLCELELKLLSAKLAKEKAITPHFDYESIRAGYPRDSVAFFNVVKRAEDQIRSI
ncbi:MAG: helix-turn-helix domain-containing protein [Clostridia bacterium]|nr:helix-turn-helix domain-containing protein [Clostridia bacterium]